MRENEQFRKQLDDLSLEAAFKAVKSNEIRGIEGDWKMPS